MAHPFKNNTTKEVDDGKDKGATFRLYGVASEFNNDGSNSPIECRIEIKKIVENAEETLERVCRDLQAWRNDTDSTERGESIIRQRLLWAVRLAERYRFTLQQIADGRDDANPIHLKQMAQITLDGEPTTADELHKPLMTVGCEEIVHGPNDPGDENDS